MAECLVCLAGDCAFLRVFWATLCPWTPEACIQSLAVFGARLLNGQDTSKMRAGSSLHGWSLGHRTTMSPRDRAAAGHKDRNKIPLFKGDLHALDET